MQQAPPTFYNAETHPNPNGGGCVLHTLANLFQDPFFAIAARDPKNAAVTIHRAQEMVMRVGAHLSPVLLLPAPSQEWDKSYITNWAMRAAMQRELEALHTNQDPAARVGFFVECLRNEIPHAVALQYSPLSGFLLLDPAQPKPTPLKALNTLNRWICDAQAFGFWLVRANDTNEVIYK